MSARDVVVFLGPSLDRRAARRLVQATFLPPARQGDVFRVLPSRPKVIVLIDGVFEAVPSVWHHELRAALACGVRVIGASSMGALRAAELHHEGLLPVGRIAGDYLTGERVDDADVALLHGPADTGYRPLTVPLVNVAPTLALARRRGLVTPSEVRKLTTLANETFYKRRSWRQLAQAISPGNARRHRSLLEWFKRNVVDQKALDAAEALRVASKVAQRARPAARVVSFSSFVRRRRLMDVHDGVLQTLERLPDADALAKQGLRRLLLASFARMAGLTVSPEVVHRVGLAEDEALADAEVLALESLVLSYPERFVPDGPTWIEGLALEARVTGRWSSLSRERRKRLR